MIHLPRTSTKIFQCTVQQIMLCASSGMGDTSDSMECLNGYPKYRKGSQRRNQCSNNFIRLLLDKDPPLSSHSVVEWPLMWEPQPSGSSLGSTPNLLPLRILSTNDCVSSVEWKNNNTCLAFYIGQWRRQKRISDYTKWKNEYETTLKAFQGLQK